jgi:YARHG domain
VLRFAILPLMKYKRVLPALALPMLASAFFLSLSPVPAQEPASTPTAPDFKTTFDRPLYYTRTITEPDLVGRTLWELTLLRNTIYARAGNTFRKKWLADYFNAQPWYHPLPAIDESKLSPIDHQNAEAIAKYDASLSRVQLRSMLQDAMGSIRASGAAPEDKIELRLLSARLGKWFGPSDTPSEERSPLKDPSVLDMQLSVDQLKDLSRRDLRLLRNTVYARYARRGRPFRSDLLRAYFEATGLTPPSSVTWPENIRSPICSAIMNIAAWKKLLSSGTCPGLPDRKVRSWRRVHAARAQEAFRSQSEEPAALV